jgi:hypothetical protein
MPPTDGFTSEHVLTMHGLPPHTELIDGSPVFVSPQRIFHALADIDLAEVDRLWAEDSGQPRYRGVACQGEEYATRRGEPR